MTVLLCFVLTVVVSVPLSFGLGYLCGKKRMLKFLLLKNAHGGKRLDYEKEVFDSLQQYFLKDRPFLNPSLSAADVAKYLCTNRTYLSEAVNLFGKSSFPAYVNYYRINYAINLFKENPDLKVSELALMCGFNSPSAFNAQFKLLMNDSPGQWFRKNRARMTRR